jgi:hypothetical protein
MWLAMHTWVRVFPSAPTTEGVHLCSSSCIGKTEHTPSSQTLGTHQGVQPRSGALELHRPEFEPVTLDKSLNLSGMLFSDQSSQTNTVKPSHSENWSHPGNNLQNPIFLALITRKSHKVSSQWGHSPQPTAAKTFPNSPGCWDKRPSFLERGKHHRWHRSLKISVHFWKTSLPNWFLCSPHTLGKDLAFVDFSWSPLHRPSPSCIMSAV